MQSVSHSVTIRRPREEVFRFWRNLENLPEFAEHLLIVEPLDERRSHWVASAPGDRTVEWDSEIVDEQPERLLSWRSLPGSEVQNQGSVIFADAPADRGTEVKVEVSYDAPGGDAGAALAKLFGKEPRQQIRDDLRRLKQVLETGEIVRSDGSPEGAGQGASKQRAAQPGKADAGS
jgi:uncharacterized membrane protein